MSFSMYSMALDTFVPMLGSLSALLDKGAEHARAKGLDPATLANARLAPDMYPLIKQIQIACDNAKGATARLMGQEPPRFEDNEQTLDELKARIAKTVEYLRTAREPAFKGAAERRIEFPLINDLVLDMSGAEYLRDWALPHFYFHVVTAYDILRHNGVEIGKRDYLSYAGYGIRQRGKT